MRVLVFSWEYPPRVVGGLSRHVQELAKAMSELAEIHVVTQASEGLSPEEDDGGVTVHRVPVAGPHTDDLVKWAMQLCFAMFGRAAGLSEALGPFDIVHAHDWLAAYAGAGVKHGLGVPLVSTIHATEWGRNWGLHNPLQRQISDIEWYLCYESWRVIVCSKHMKSELMGVFGVPEDKIEVIPNGVFPEQFREADVDMWRERYAAPGEDVILYVGRLVHEKGVHLLVEAMPKILQYWPAARLIIAGRGPAEGHLRDLGNRLGLGGKVSLVGFVSDEARNALYRMARVAVVPSLYEPFGITALEAMAAGTPLVVADTGGLSETVEHSVNGWKFYSGNSGSLADAVLHLLHEPATAKGLAEAALRAIGDVYDWKKIAQRTIEVYGEVLHKARQARMQEPVHVGSPAAGETRRWAMQ
ncbi:MAG: glycosyltransferase family 4 protein [Firmicutes bacterium]|nr:glycosyltransferase family 4 protein [Bacillota bacterium]